MIRFWACHSSMHIFRYIANHEEQSEQKGRWSFCPAWRRWISAPIERFQEDILNAKVRTGVFKHSESLSGSAHDTGCTRLGCIEISILARKIRNPGESQKQATRPQSNMDLGKKGPITTTALSGFHVNSGNCSTGPMHPIATNGCDSILDNGGRTN